jgi:hypothetical protein
LCFQIDDDNLNAQLSTQRLDGLSIRFGRFFIAGEKMDTEHIAFLLAEQVGRYQ